MKIKSVEAIEVLDSRGKPTISTSVKLEDGSAGRSFVPSGASTGQLEAYELRDCDEKRYFGQGVKQAVRNVNEILAPELLAKNIFDQIEIDKLMIDLDNTKNKSNLGANSILSVSMAASKAAANSSNLELYEYLRVVFEKILGKKINFSIPKPMLNIFNGGAHANNKIDIQEFMIVPNEKLPYSDGLRLSAEVYQNLKAVLKNKGYSTAVGDEGGFASDLSSNEEVLTIIAQSLERIGLQVGSDISLALDCAASEFFRHEKYELKGIGKSLSSRQMIEYLASLCKKFNVSSVEDPFSESDWKAWSEFTREMTNLQIVGDDLFVTQKKLLAKGIKEKSANSILIKLNQVGTLTETLETIALSKNNNFSTIISHRSGETEDSFISDLAVAVNADFIKSGAPARSDRTAKYNRLLIIENELYP